LLEIVQSLKAKQSAWIFIPAATVAILIMLSIYAATDRPAYSMGAPPGTCNNSYDYVVKSFTITANGQTYDPLANSDVKFNADTSKGYDVTMVVHTASQSNSGNTLPGQIWYVHDGYGFESGECADVAAPNSDQTVTVNGVVMGQEATNPNANGDLQQVEWDMGNVTTPGAAPTITAKVNYNVVWFSPSNFPSSSDTTTASSGSSPTTTSSSTSSTTSSSVSSSTTSIASTTLSSSGTTTIASTQSATIPAPGSTVVQQGTVASSNSGGTANAIILSPASNIEYTGIMSWAASKPIGLYILEPYSVNSTQTVSGAFGQPTTINVNGQLYAVTALSSVGQSESTVFSGSGLMLSSSAGPFLATYTLKASVDTPAVASDFSSALQ
jgi:hypothetical protein